MKSLKEKMKEVREEHKAELKENLVNKTIHLGNLKNISAGDEIYVYWGSFHTVAKMCEVTMLAGDALYIKNWDIIFRFNAYNCKKWDLDTKKPGPSETTKEENWNLADGIPSVTIVEYPIINVKYKEKQQVPEGNMCYNIKEQTACPFLSYFNGFYNCDYLHRTMYENPAYLDRINAQICKAAK